MQAIVQHGYRTVDVLRLQDVDEPTPGPHEVLGRVHAAAVNHGDWFVTSGRPDVMRAALGLRGPRVAVRGRDVTGRDVTGRDVTGRDVTGRDVTGRVATVGAAVTGFRPGDDVHAAVAAGSFAGYVCVPERMPALKPADLTAVQIAKALGADVTGVQLPQRRAGRFARRRPRHRLHPGGHLAERHARAELVTAVCGGPRSTIDEGDRP
ncbi:alcohol dehydrogenase catalytic domain-containing protein [Pseudonocardia abyssalis]|uniref:alcohol dehydrogenase catalytic domain-containing protein n=1 Tax=Pseudonocardia abyssalis TaxID=2792008 RepID=UPI001C4A2DE4|nr:hypothetical protein [Pseudonocardia abyssalis]